MEEWPEKKKPSLVRKAESSNGIRTKSFTEGFGILENFYFPMNANTMHLDQMEKTRVRTWGVGDIRPTVKHGGGCGSAGMHDSIRSGKSLFYRRLHEQTRLFKHSSRTSES
jgi:hypothetical protein